MHKSKKTTQEQDEDEQPKKGKSWGDPIMDIDF
jgi:hypothetical protein